MERRLGGRKAIIYHEEHKEEKEYKERTATILIVRNLPGPFWLNGGAFHGCFLPDWRRSRITPLPDEYILRSKADQRVLCIVYPALRLGVEHPLHTQIAGVDADGLLGDKLGR